MITITIPVKISVKKYLIKRYGLVHTISKKSFFGLLVLELLNNKVESPERDFLGFEKYELKIPEYYFNIKGFSINRNKAKFLGNCLEKLFFEDFHAFVDLELMKGANAMKSIKLFLAVYEIQESEMKLESMYRNYQRYSKEQIKEKKKQTIVY